MPHPTTPPTAGPAVLFSRRRLAGALAAATLAAAGGCAMPPLSPAAAPAEPGAFVEPPSGSVTRFERRGSGSLADGPAVVEWTHGHQSWQGRDWYAAVSSQLGTQLHDPATHALVATLAPDGSPRWRYDPPVGYRFPLAVGQRWEVNTTLTTPGRAPLALAMRYEVEAVEPVDVPAGRFSAFRVRVQNSLGETETVWTAPSLGLGVVRRIVDRPAGHPAGAGRLETVLVARTVAGR
jgi:hypothetical protein